MINRSTPVAIATAVLLAGCSLIPTYERPAAPVAAQYTRANATAAAEGGTAAAQLPWQDFFQDARLQQLVRTALDNNRDLRVAALNIERAQAQYRITRADQFPTVGAGVNASRAPNTTGSGAKYVNSYQVGLAVTSWELDFFGRIGSLKEAALAQYLATEEARRAAQTSLVAAVASGWYTLLADEQLLKISRDTLRTRVDSTKRPNCTIKFLTRAEAHSTLVFHIDLLFLQGAAAMDCGTPLHIRFSATDLCFFGARPRWPAAKRGLQAHRTRGGRSELGHQGLPGVSGSRASRPPEASASKASTLSWPYWANALGGGTNEDRRLGR